MTHKKIYSLSILFALTALFPPFEVLFLMPYFHPTSHVVTTLFVITVAYGGIIVSLPMLALSLLFLLAGLRKKDTRHQDEYALQQRTAVFALIASFLLTVLFFCWIWLAS